MDILDLKSKWISNLSIFGGILIDNWHYKYVIFDFKTFEDMAEKMLLQMLI